MYQSLLAMTSEVLSDNDRHLVQAEIYCCPVGEKDNSRALSEEEAFLLFPELWRL